MFKSILFPFLILLLLSCNGRRGPAAGYTLQATDGYLEYPLEGTSKLTIKALFPYRDKDGQEYLTLQTTAGNRIVFYEMATGQPVFEIQPDWEGPNGTGPFLGYYVQDLDNLYLTALGKAELIRIDRNARIKEKIRYDEAADRTPLHAANALSFVYKPLYLLNGQLYILSECNRLSSPNPVSACIDTATHAIRALPFSYPSFPHSENKAKAYGVESSLSRCFDGQQFVYSFHFDETLYVASPDHQTVRKIPARSRYIPHVEIPDENKNYSFAQMLKRMCENPNYGNLIHDPYRNVYYRIAYPRTEIEPDENCVDIWQYGRKKFSILILDENFQVVGETLLPENTYNSTLWFVRADGLYLSTGYFMNPDFQEDRLVFRRFCLAGPPTR